MSETRANEDTVCKISHTKYWTQYPFARKHGRLLTLEKIIVCICNNITQVIIKITFLRTNRSFPLRGTRIEKQKQLVKISYKSIAIHSWQLWYMPIKDMKRLEAFEIWVVETDVKKSRIGCLDSRGIVKSEIVRTDFWTIYT